jgi:hypothetical protein
MVRIKSNQNKKQSGKITWIGVGLVNPKSAQAISKGRDKLSCKNESALNDVPSEGAKKDFLSPALPSSPSSL